MPRPNVKQQLNSSEPDSASIIRHTWMLSKSYRILLSAAIAYAVLRLSIFLMLHAGMLPLPEDNIVWQDFSLYLDASRNLLRGEQLYPDIPRLYEYQYPPAFALGFAPILWLPTRLIPIIGAVGHILAYIFLYRRWIKIFVRIGLPRGTDMLARTLPLWLVFEPFWSDLDLLNVYILTALLATFAIEAVLDERAGWAALWLVILLQIKPHWAFVIFVPLLVGQYRFFFKVTIFTVVGYAAASGITMLLVGPEYGWEQYGEYLKLLQKLLRQDYLYRTSEQGFLGYNHSIKQIAIFLAGTSKIAIISATGIKAGLLLALAAVCLFRRTQLNSFVSRGILLPKLELSFALYLLAFIWLDVVWEVSLSIVVFSYLLAVIPSREGRIWICVSFTIYALVDVWRLVSFGIFGPRIIEPPNYILTDPTLYIPLIMIVIISLYFFLLRRLWATGDDDYLIGGANTNTHPESIIGAKF